TLLLPSSVHRPADTIRSADMLPRTACPQPPVRQLLPVFRPRQALPRQRITSAVRPSDPFLSSAFSSPFPNRHRATIRRMMRLAAGALLVVLTLPLGAQERTDDVVARIRAEGLERSRVLETFHHLT